MNRRTLRSALAALLLLWPMAAWGEAGRPAERLHSVQARFTQEKRLPVLARPLIAHGLFAFQSPGSLRWEYLDPYRSLLLLHAGQIRKWIDRDGALVPDNGPGVDALRLVLEDLGSWLDGRFADNPQFIVERRGERTVVLTPREAGLAAVISRIELELGRTAGVVEQVTIHEGPEAFTQLRFFAIELNRPIPEAVFSQP